MTDLVDRTIRRRSHECRKWVDPPVRYWSRGRPESLRVFGRLPVIGARACTEAGVRKASREETAGEFAPAVVSDYGDLAPAFALMLRVRAGKDG